MKERSRKKYVLKFEPVTIVITPYVLAKISNDLHTMADLFKEDGFSLAKYSIYLSSIERGLKAAILSKDHSKEKKLFLEKIIRHNLKNAIIEFESVFGELFTEEEKDDIEKINDLYCKKGFDYFTDDMLMEMVRAYNNLPEMINIGKISKKVNYFIVDKKLFIDVK